ncbi:MAG TPA: hypothetical protein VH815_03120 [Acidobacteriota bacterium]|jgi:hypothetical protein
MENVGNTESRNRNEGNASTTTDVSGVANSDGGSVRTNDGKQSSIDVGSASGKIGTPKSIGYDVRSIGGNSNVEITDGYYFTPNGTITRIPDGHYIDNSGRLRKRRQKRSTSNADGNTHRDRPETGEHEAESISENIFLGDKPLNVRPGKRGRKKSVKEETSKLTMVTLLASGASAIFTSVALLTKHEHWKLHIEEGKILAEALNDAISTLPEKYYAQVIGIIEGWIPWINLCFVVGAIVVPRIEASAKQIERKHSPKSEPSNERDERSADNPFSTWSSLGYNQ